jgi:hypothetical protein
VWIDLSGWSPKYFPPQLVQYANTQLRTKVLFGSDFPLITPDRWLADFEAAPFKDEVRPLVLKENAARLLRTLVIETVRGPVAPEALGRTLPHEHVFILGQETLANFNHRWGKPWWDEEAGVADAVAKLQRVVDAGFSTFVDPTAVGLGRDIARIARVNEQVDLNIVVCTGVYAFMELPQFLRYRTVDALAGFFVHELREGIGDTGREGGLHQVRDRGIRSRRRRPDDPRRRRRRRGRDRRAGDGAHELRRQSGVLALEDADGRPASGPRSS